MDLSNNSGRSEKESIGHGVKLNIQINISDWLRSNPGSRGEVNDDFSVEMSL
jgi:hypothetical protein